MKVLMFGWENSPAENSGVGVACQALASALKLNGAEVTLFTPSTEKEEKVKKVETASVENIQSEKVTIKTHYSGLSTYYTMGASLRPYHSLDIIERHNKPKFVNPACLHADALFRPVGFSRTLSVNYMLEQVEVYSLGCLDLIKEEKFDVIYAHDWMSFRAGMLAKNMLKIPLICHVHSTEYDRSLFTPVAEIINEEAIGLRGADHVIAVSEKSAKVLFDKFEIHREKITVLHNGVISSIKRKNLKKRKTQYMTFVGRMEYQKGPGYFIDMAEAITEEFPGLLFIMVGEGSLLNDLKARVAASRISNKVSFAGAISQKKLNEILKKTTLMYQPTIHEPFGMAALEAVSMGVPVVVSNDTGMIEAVPSIIRVDYWDLYTNRRVLGSLLGDKEKLAAYAKTCAREAHPKLSLEEVGALLIDTFNQFIRK